MSSALDKSLDEIISSKGGVKNLKSNRKKGAKPVKAGKGLGKGKAINKSSKPTKLVAKQVKAPVTSVSGVSATKAVFYGLPKDTKQEALKEFFQSQVGGVSNFFLTYNEKGQSKGIATVVFKSSQFAEKAFTKFNGAPIDGGRSTLKIELIMDPSKKAAAVNLSSRIKPNTTTKAPVKTKAALKAKKVADLKKKAVAKAKAKPKPKVKKPKTVEDLDQEMNEYFEKKD